MLQQVLNVDLAVVANTNGLCLPGLDESFHILPGLYVVVVPQDIAVAIRQKGKSIGITAIGSRAVWVHANRPVNEEEVDIVETQGLQGLIKTNFGAGGVCVPELGHHEDVLTLNSRIKSCLEALADFVFVCIAVCCVDELVTGL